MTPEERSLLQQFLSDLDGSRGVAKDPDADGIIAGALNANPDAAYLLVQHAIVSDQALQAAQQRIVALQQEAERPQSSAPTPAAWTPPQPPPQSPLAPNSGLGGFLRSAGTLAAGMAGGEFLAQGLSNLFSPRDW